MDWLPIALSTLTCEHTLAIADIVFSPSPIFCPTPASKPGSTGLLTHIRGQGLMDLEFENDGDSMLVHVTVM